jgi:DNA-binding response OmpR family regulator
VSFPGGSQAFLIQRIFRISGRSRVPTSDHPVRPMNAIAAKPTVLIIDDEFLIASEIEAILHDVGFKSEIATTREQAFSVIDEGSVDLAIVDLHLGAGRVSSDIAVKLDGANIPYVICTGSMAEEAEEWFANATIVAKPFLPQQIVDAVRSKIGSPVA